MERDLLPWLIPDDAFRALRNMYVFRGRVRKRFGTQLMSDNDAAVDPEVAQLNSRLRIDIGNTPGPLNIPGTTAVIKLKIGQMFSVGTDMFTVYQLGAGVVTYSTNGAITCTIDSTANPNTVTFAGAAGGVSVFFYPALPVMGITQFETNAINDEPTYAFDTQFSYQYTGGGWDRLGTAIWTGNNDDFFWSTSYRGATADLTLLFTTNFFFGANLNDSDPIRYWDTAAWNNFQPQWGTNATDTILTCRVIVPFKDRLLLFNVVENTGGAPGTNTQYGNRLRFSQNGSPLDASGWREDIPGRGGFLDAPTQEQIITVEFLKDRLIVFFERSTWEIVYTGNEVLPFRWQQINTELGAESTFSIVPFDKVAIGVGNVGVHACNGANVERIDEKIPDEVFDIHNENDGVKRVVGVRDYDTELIYWTFPSDVDDVTYPSRVLVFNYRTGSWAINDDSFTFFGYFQNENDKTWRSAIETWEQADYPWNFGVLQSQHRRIIAGNQQGWMLLVDPDINRNAPSLQITAINTTTNNITVIDHNLQDSDYVAIENLQGTTSDATIYQIRVIDSDTIRLLGATLATAYTGGGTVARVSNPQITSKQYNFFNQIGRNIEVTETDFYVSHTANGEFSIDYSASSSVARLGTVILETRPYNPVLVPFEQTQSRLWHRAYLDAEGNNFQIFIYLSDAQIRNENIAWSDIQIHAIMFHVSTTRDRFE